MSDKTSSSLTKWSGYQFTGTIWNIVAHSERPVLIIETRDEESKTVRFSAYDIGADTFNWKDFELEERWWVSVSVFADDVVLFTVYLDKQNPDRKSVVAIDHATRKMLWWRNNFAFSAVTNNIVQGADTQAGMKVLSLNLKTGEPLENIKELSREENIKELSGEENFLLRRPLQYLQESGHFETVAQFLKMRLGVQAVSAVEYLEIGGFIVISFYSDTPSLANYLIVVNEDGTTCLSEKIGEQLKGIGLDTFFIFAGYLIFVKNKRELVSYKLV
jgi:hypothetical protein